MRLIAWREEIPYLGNFWASGQPWRHPGCLLPLAAGKRTFAKMVRDTQTTFAVQRAIFGARALRITALLWRGRRPSRDKMKMGRSDSPLLVAPGWTFTAA